MDPQRRRLCQVAGLVVAGAAIPGCGSNANNSSDAGPLACGSTAVELGIQISDVQPGTATLISSTSLASTQLGAIYVCRDDQGIYAMDAGCTHMGCQVDPDQVLPTAHAMSGQPLPLDGFQCHCHGATFDANGGSPTGPARGPLPHYLVCATVSGVLVVDPGQVVDPAVRYRL
jgi:Rieske Fe-S protein